VLTGDKPKRQRAYQRAVLIVVKPGKKQNGQRNLVGSMHNHLIHVFANILCGLLDRLVGRWHMAFQQGQSSQRGQTNRRLLELLGLPAAGVRTILEL